MGKKKKRGKKKKKAHNYQLREQRQFAALDYILTGNVAIRQQLGIDRPYPAKIYNIDAEKEKINSLVPILSLELATT